LKSDFLQAFAPHLAVKAAGRMSTAAKKKSGPPAAPLSADDLHWFDYTKYSSEHLYSLDLDGWIGLLTDRLVLKSMAGGPMRLSALEGMTELADNPFASLGFKPPQLLGSHPTDTATVFLARSGVISEQAKAITQHQHKPTDIFDLAEKARPGALPLGFVTIQVDLRAKRTQVKRDFNAWLTAMDKKKVGPKPPKLRDYSKPAVFKDWIENDYLPYFDLQLFATLSGRRLPPRLAAEQLCLISDHDPDSPDASDVLKAPRTSLDVFNLDTVYAMWRLRDGLAT